MIILCESINFKTFNDLLIIINFKIDKITPNEFLDFIDNLDNKKLSYLVINPKQSNRLNLLGAVLEDLGDYGKAREGVDLYEKILKIVGIEYYEYLLKQTLDKKGYIRLPILEALVYINGKEAKKFLLSTPHKFKFGFSADIKWDFHLILYILLFCFDPEELMLYLEKNHRTDLLTTVLPEMSWFKYLKMSSRHEIDMEHFITAFLLENVSGEHTYNNLDKLGLFLADIMLSEISDRDNEINEEINLRVIRALDWVGGEAENKLNELSKHYNIKKYRDILY